MALVFTVDEALQYSNDGIIEEWIHSFLTTVGNNRGLSDGLKLQKRYWIGPVLVNVNELYRSCGPETDMEFVEPVENWEARVNKLCESIKNGWSVPPLIAANVAGKLSLRDGNHRLEALQRMNYKQFWVIIWDSDSMENLLKWTS